MPDTPLSQDRDALDTRTSAPNSYVSMVVEYDDRPDECTIYPLGLDDGDLMTTWISAEEDSFVSLDEMR